MKKKNYYLLKKLLRQEIGKLYINFNATIVDDLGVYRNSFKNEDNEDVWIATTQFEPTAARMAFPCWDEPEYKSIFSITLTSDENLVRVSNEKLQKRQQIMVELLLNLLTQ